MPFSSLLFSTTSRNSVNSFCSNGVLSPCKYNKFRQSVRLLYICKSTSYYVFQSFSIFCGKWNFTFPQLITQTKHIKSVAHSSIAMFSLKTLYAGGTRTRFFCYWGGCNVHCATKPGHAYKISTAMCMKKPSELYIRVFFVYKYSEGRILFFSHVRTATAAHIFFERILFERIMFETLKIEIFNFSRGKERKTVVELVSIFGQNEAIKIFSDKCSVRTNWVRTRGRPKG
jgi:hypothetical protein